MGPEQPRTPSFRADGARIVVVRGATNRTHYVVHPASPPMQFRVGSGRECNWNVWAPEVAHEHFDIIWDGDAIAIAPHPGAPPLQVNGATHRHSLRLTDDAQVVFGDGCLFVGRGTDADVSAPKDAAPPDQHFHVARPPQLLEPRSRARTAIGHQAAELQGASLPPPASHSPGEVSAVTPSEGAGGWQQQGKHVTQRVYVRDDHPSAAPDSRLTHPGVSVRPLGVITVKPPAPTPEAPQRAPSAVHAPLARTVSVPLPIMAEPPRQLTPRELPRSAVYEELDSVLVVPSPFITHGVPSEVTAAGNPARGASSSALGRTQPSVRRTPPTLPGQVPAMEQAMAWSAVAPLPREVPPLAEARPAQGLGSTTVVYTSDAPPPAYVRQPRVLPERVPAPSPQRGPLYRSYTDLRQRFAREVGQDLSRPGSADNGDGTAPALLGAYRQDDDASAQSSYVVPAVLALLFVVILLPLALPEVREELSAAAVRFEQSLLSEPRLEGLGKDLAGLLRNLRHWLAGLLTYTREHVSKLLGH
jgi:hypothetical protein